MKRVLLSLIGLCGLIQILMGAAPDQAANGRFAFRSKPTSASGASLGMWFSASLVPVAVSGFAWFWFTAPFFHPPQEADDLPDYANDHAVSIA